MFVEWVTEHIYPSPQEERMHRRLAELSQRWTTSHPCWHPGTMPLLADTEDWPRTPSRRCSARLADAARTDRL